MFSENATTVHLISRRGVVIAFLSSSALWNAEPIPQGSAERQKIAKTSAYFVPLTNDLSGRSSQSEA